MIMDNNIKWEKTRRKELKEIINNMSKNGNYDNLINYLILKEKKIRKFNQK